MSSEQAPILDTGWQGLAADRQPPDPCIVCPGGISFAALGAANSVVFEGDWGAMAASRAALNAETGGLGQGVWRSRRPWPVAVQSGTRSVSAARSGLAPAPRQGRPLQAPARTCRSPPRARAHHRVRHGARRRCAERIHSAGRSLDLPAGRVPRHSLAGMPRPGSAGRVGSEAVKRGDPQISPEIAPTPKEQP